MRSLLAFPLVLVLAACAQGPVPIEYGSARCSACRMGIVEPHFGAELITRRGKVHTYDSIECMASDFANGAEQQNARSVWVTDYNAPGVLIDAQTSAFLASPHIRSPMGLGLAAFSSAADRDAALDSLGGEALDWASVRSYVERKWPGGSPHGDHAGMARGDAALGGEVVAAGVEANAGRTIAAAIRAAAPGDRIVIRAGVYREQTIVVDKAVELVGEEGAVLDGEGERPIMVIVADGVTVRGLVFRNTGTSYVEDRAAVKLERVRDCEIKGNRFESTFFAIYLASAADCLIEGNVLEATNTRESASGNGIHLWYSKSVTIRDNTIRGHRDGIYFEFVEDSRVERNRSGDNLRYGLHFMFSDGCSYVDNVFHHNGAGVAVMYTSDVEMRGNAFTANRGAATYGLLLKDIRDSRIERNRFASNSVALYSEGSRRVEVTGNEFEDNGWAVKVMANSIANRFEANNFRGNTFDVSTNSRQNENVFDGNFWDAYRGHDLDRDGVGDVAYRPVRLFSLIVERNEPLLILSRSFLVDLLDAAESVIPSLVPETLVDGRPYMQPIERGGAS